MSRYPVEGIPRKSEDLARGGVGDVDTVFFVGAAPKPGYLRFLRRYRGIEFHTVGVSALEKLAE